MADTVDITAGSGTKVSTEEVTTLNGGAVTAQHVQRVAAAFRTADGVASDAATGAGVVAAGVQRTTLASDDPAVAALGATNSSAAANPSATAGLNGLIKGMWTGLVAGIGAIGDAAWVSGNGSAIALLKTIATAAADTTTPVPTISDWRLIPVTFSLDTAAYASGDLLADAQSLGTSVRANDACAVWISVGLESEDDIAADFDLYLYGSSASWGTENAAPSISDTNARSIIGYVSIAAADWKDLGGVRFCQKTSINLIAKPASGTQNIYCAAVLTAGTPTFTAAGIRAQFGLGA